MDATFNGFAPMNNVKIKRKRTKLCDRPLPYYTRGEEIFNMVSHIVGGAVGLATLALCLIYLLLKEILWEWYAEACSVCQ